MTDTKSSVQHGSHRVLKKFAYLFSAHWVRELFETAFQISLARMSEVTFGEFMLALSIGQILRFVAECGLNQHLSAMLARKDNYPTILLTQFTLIKFFILSISWLVMLGFIYWQGYSPSLKVLVIIIATAVGLETLVSSFTWSFRYSAARTWKAACAPLARLWDSATVSRHWLWDCPHWPLPFSSSSKP